MDRHPVLVDLEGLADALSISKRSLQEFYEELPHVRMPYSQGDDGRGVRFSVEDVKAYLIGNHGINYGRQQVQDENRYPVSSTPVCEGAAGSVQIGVQDQKGRKKVAGKGRGAMAIRRVEPNRNGLRRAG